MSSIIKQIASDLNVSNATVSRALNDRPGVSDGLRKKILDYAQQLNVVPSMTARGLASNKTFTIGFFVTEKQNVQARFDPFYGEIMHGVEDVLSNSDHHLAFGTLSPTVLKAPQQFRFTREGRIDGMILAGPHIPSDFILTMQQTNLPVVLVDNKLTHSAAHSINSDDQEGAFQAASYLMELGHRRIGILSGPAHWPSNRERVSGYREALEQAGIEGVVVHAESTTIDSGQETYARLMAVAPDITGICAVNDSMAIGALRSAQAAGRQIPRDLSIVGFDNITWAEINDPPLTTLHIPKVQMGKEAAKRLLDLLEEPELPPTNLTLGVELVKRASCDVPGTRR